MSGDPPVAEYPPPAIQEASSSQYPPVQPSVHPSQPPEVELEEAMKELNAQAKVLQGILMHRPPNTAHEAVIAKCTCGHEGQTKVEYKIGAGTWKACMCICVCCFCCLGAMFLPFCNNACKDAHHHCSHCGAKLGVHKPIK